MTETELDRIRAEYEARDAVATSPYRWDNPRYVWYMQIVERALLRAFRDAGVSLAGARVLDVGSGSGYFLHRLPDYGAAEGHGIDLMGTEWRSGESAIRRSSSHVGSATELPLRTARSTWSRSSPASPRSSTTTSGSRSHARCGVSRPAAGSFLRHARPSPAGFPRQGPPGRRPFRLDEAELRTLFGDPALLRRRLCPSSSPSSRDGTHCSRQRSGRFPRSAATCSPSGAYREQLRRPWNAVHAHQVRAPVGISFGTPQEARYSFLSSAFPVTPQPMEEVVVHLMTLATPPGPGLESSNVRAGETFSARAFRRPPT